LIARRGDDDIDDGWTSAVSSGFALAGFLSLVFVAFTLLAMGPFVRYDAYFNLDPPPAAWVPFLHVLDRIGQRAVALPILAGALYYVYRRNRSWRPVVVAGASVFMLNLLVLVLKLGLGRASPHTADPSFFAGGMAYPSGHSANIVLMYGLVAYLVSSYAAPSRTTKTLMWGVVACLAVTMVVTSLTLNWHWFADLVAGLLVGGIVLELTATVDRMLPTHLFSAGGWSGVRAAYVDTQWLLRSLLRRPQGQ
jgi:membrane-associated phospholipid phosphatase